MLEMSSKYLKCQPFLASAAFVVLAVFAAERIGFCWARMRVVSDREKIEAAVATMLRLDRVAIRDPENESWWYLIADMPTFETTEAFLEAYPDCCHVRAAAVGEYAMTGEIVVVGFPAQYAGYSGVGKTGNVKAELAVKPRGRIVTDSSD